MESPKGSQISCKFSLRRTNPSESQEDLVIYCHTKEDLLEKFYYCCKTGKLYHKRGPLEGKEAGSITKDGYRVICTTVNGKQKLMLVHRLVWFLETGDAPKPPQVLDHINHDPDDNRIENLRLVTQKENCRNRKSKKVKKLKDSRYVDTSVFGVRFDKKYNCYIVTTSDNKVLDAVYDFDLAKEIRWDWEFSNGFYVNHGVDP